MAKPRKQSTAPEPPIVPRVGDKVTIPRASGVLEVEQVSRDGSEVTLRLPGTNLQWFRIHAETLTYVERQAASQDLQPFHDSRARLRHRRSPREDRQRPRGELTAKR